MAIPERQEQVGRPEVVVITGASAGVGRATARAFGARGACVGLMARASEGLEAAAREIEHLGGRALALPIDVAIADDVEYAAARVEETFGAIDVWVNNAMATIFAPFAEITPEEFRRATEVTYLGYVHMDDGRLEAHAPAQSRQHRAGRLGARLPRNPAAGTVLRREVRDPRLHRFAPQRALARALEGSHHDGKMPALNTPQFDWGRNKLAKRPQPVPPIFQPEVAARAIVFAAHARRREVWVGRSTIGAILLNKLVPGLLDDYLATSGYSGQLSSEPADPQAPDNLFESVTDHAAHGRFDARASSFCPALTASIYKPYIYAAGAALTLAVVLRAFWQQGSRPRGRTPAILPRFN